MSIDEGEMFTGRTAITERFFSADSHWLDLTMAQKRRTQRGYYVTAKALCGLRATWSTSACGGVPTCARCRAERAKKQRQELTR